MTDNFEKDINVPSKEIIDTTRCAWKSLEGTYCPEVEQLLKRKEQEYKTLEEIAKKHLAETFEMQREIDQLKAENEDLKEIIQRHDNDNNALLSEFEDDLVEYYRRHRECLIEIKEICGIGIVNGLSEEQYLSELRDWQEQILNKISEVIKDEDI